MAKQKLEAESQNEDNEAVETAEAKAGNLELGENAVIIDRVDVEGVHLRNTKRLRELKGLFIPDFIFEKVCNKTKDSILNDMTYRVKMDAQRQVDNQELIEKQGELQKAIVKKDKVQIEKLTVSVGKLAETPPDEYIVEFDCKKCYDELQGWKEWLRNRKA